MTLLNKNMFVSFTITLHLSIKKPRLTKEKVGDIHRDYVTPDIILIDVDFERHQALLDHRNSSVIDACNLLGFWMFLSWQFELINYLL